MSSHKTPSESELASVREILSSRTGSFVSRERLAELAELSDRVAREAVSELRRRGEPIVTDASGSGYKLSTDPAELDATVAFMSSYISSQVQVRDALAACAKRMRFQQQRERERDHQAGLFA